MKEYLIELLDYELWANHRIITALEAVSNPPQRAVAVMGHILSAQQVWIGRITNQSVFVSIWEDIPVSWMAETADRQHRQVKSYVSGLSEGQLAESISYKDSKGNPHQTPLVEILTHMSHHAAYHRGQIVQLIRPMLAEAPVTDYIIWSREKQK
ncbi:MULTISPECIES: DinB family protein [unclassified Spirosoma]|uniref:DinB family protein n=1 Tax=unclassified Spirosoma TaxID=2621999 RepID=UPI00095D7C80|nr:MULTISPECIES: DinB family protein [unclassified Spirosoma]MBN8823439.1 DinB family protein [Spirosoma sp.]OJW71945.1 MAG: damage-inducible protein DinB [Spirosoma sp. 48-14]